MKTSLVLCALILIGVAVYFTRVGAWWFVPAMIVFNVVSSALFRWIERHCP